MDLTDKLELSENSKGAINGDEPNAWVFPMHLFIYSGRGKVVATEDNCIQNRSPLPSELITVLP